MRFLLSARGWIALCAVFGPATVTAAPPAEEAVILPNAADPKPDTVGSQGGAQAVVVSLEKRSTSAGNAQPQSQNTTAPPGKRGGMAAPFHKPKPN